MPNLMTHILLQCSWQPIFIKVKFKALHFYPMMFIIINHNQRWSCYLNNPNFVITISHLACVTGWAVLAYCLSFDFAIC